MSQRPIEFCSSRQSWGLLQFGHKNSPAMLFW
jgi:hypothetical protein